MGEEGGVMDWLTGGLQFFGAGLAVGTFGTLFVWALCAASSDAAEAEEYRQWMEAEQATGEALVDDKCPLGATEKNTPVPPEPPPAGRRLGEGVKTGR